MNPIDHPNGGNTAGGGQPKTPFGKLAKFVPTRKERKIRR
jgi:ribosomal protein L2